MTMMFSKIWPSWSLTITIIALYCATSTNARPFDSRSASLDERYGINNELSSCLTNKKVDFVDALRNDSHIYYEASQGDNMRFHWHPVAIIYPTNVHQVSDAVNCASKSGNIQTVARSGGHAFTGYSSGGQDGAMIVDFRQMNKIISDSKNALVHIEPAARLGDVAKDLWADDQMAMPHGTCPTVGVGGHSLCGGVGPTSRLWGMATDNIVEIEMVLADGNIVHVSQHENPDLFWAMRGAGVYYGLVTKFTFSTYKVNHPTTFLRYKWAESLKTPDDAVKVMHAIQEFGKHPDLPNSIGFHVQVSPIESAGGSGGMIALQLRGMYLGPKDVYIDKVAAKLYEQIEKVNLPIKGDSFNEDEMSYLDLMKEWDDFGSPNDKLDTQLERQRRNSFVARTSLGMSQKGFSDEGFRTILNEVWQRQVDEKMGSFKAHSTTDKDFWVWNIYFELFGGVHNRMRDPEILAKSSFSHRDALWLMQTSVGGFATKSLVHEAYAMVHKIDSAIHKALQDDKLERMGYSCYADPTLQDWKHLYYGKSLDKMTNLKRKYDPKNLFRNPQSLIETPRDLVTGLKQWILSPHPLP